MAIFESGLLSFLKVEQGWIKTEVIDFWVKNLILTVIGGLIIAFIIGEGSLFQGNLIDRAENLKATIAVRQSMCTIEVQNNLLVPVKVSVDGAYIWTLEAGSTKIKGSFENKILSFESETPMRGHEFFRPFC